MAEDGESRLSRWSRLKRRRGGAMPVASDEPRAAPPSVPGEEGAENADRSQQVASRPAESGAEQTPPQADRLPAEEPPVDLPPVESLNKDSDFKAFLADGVPEELKRAALRKLWLSDPAFAFRDGLDDYDENFRIVDKMLATADELRKGWKSTEEQAKTAASGEEKPEEEKPEEEKDEDGAGDAEIAAAEDVEEVVDAEDNDETPVDSAESDHSEKEPE